MVASRITSLLWKDGETDNASFSSLDTQDVEREQL